MEHSGISLARCLYSQSDDIWNLTMYIKVIPWTTKTFIYLLLLLITNNTAQHNTTHYTILTVRIPAQENSVFIVTLVSSVVSLSFKSLNKVTCKIYRQV
jgi:hypothetical protein